MPELPPIPSRPLRFVSTAALWSLVALALAWVGLALGWGLLHWLIVPRISEFRPQLELQASKALGLSVKVGAISAQSNGLIPSFELSDVRLIDTQGRDALRLPRVLVALSPRSVWRLGFEQLYIDQPQLDVRRSADGKLHVAGLDLSGGASSDHTLADWLFSQTEFVIHDGTVRWTDEQRAAPALALTQVNFVMRNKGRRHDFRLDATPPLSWGEPLSVRALLRQPLFSRGRGRWQEWDGLLYADTERVDLSQLRQYADLGAHVAQGSGALRIWADVDNGQMVGASADVALAEVGVTLRTDLAALELHSVFGRLGGRLLASGFEFSTEGLQFHTRDGLRWPGGDVSLTQVGAEGRLPARGEIKADRLNLAALAQIADKLPIDAPLRASLRAYAPSGLIERLQASWQGPLGSPVRFDARGRVSDLQLAARPSPLPHGVGSPGVRGASIDFDLNQDGGKAKVMLRDGALEFPGVFDEPRITLSALAGDVQWQVRDDRLAVQVPNLTFDNQDTQGEAQVKWETAVVAAGSGRSRYPGVLDLQGILSRVQGSRVHRYLPLVLHSAAREYVRDAVLAGTASAVRFKVRGDLYEMPFRDPKQGEFRISANVRDAMLAYVPRRLQPADSLPWPGLSQLSGELVIDNHQLQVLGAKGRVGSSGSLQVLKAQAVIPDLEHAQRVLVDADMRGALSDMLAVVKTSPVGAMTGQALSQSTATGNADLRLKLDLPIGALEKTTVQGSLKLPGNDLHVVPEMPRLLRARGTVDFTEAGFSVTAGQARMLGGDTRIEGALSAASMSTTPTPALRGSGVPVLRFQGMVSAEGIRQAKELGFLSRLGGHASGAANYLAVLGFRLGVPELSITSNLQGMGLSLPAPLRKTPEGVLPLKIATALLRDGGVPGRTGTASVHDQISVELGDSASVVYQRDVSGAQPVVLRGGIGVGLTAQEALRLPESGVVGNINVVELDLDLWAAVLSQTAVIGAATPQPGAAASGYLPSSMAMRARELRFGGRTINNAVVGVSREGQLWRVNLDANEINGYVEYRQPTPDNAGRVNARLARLALGASAASEVEAMLDEQPDSIPALDIVVDDFDLRGKKLGRLEIEAVNRGRGTSARDTAAREWRLNKFNIIMPEAVWSASGNWVSINAQTAGVATTRRGKPERRRTVMNFKLDVTDGGALLSRLGMVGVVRRGKGKLEGQVAWMGSPLSVDYASMGGAFAVNIETGQFLKAEPGIAKLLGVLSLQSLPRRLSLDFRDVFSEGFAFDFFRGDVTVEQGIAKTNNLQMKGVNAAVLMDGSADLARETQDIKVVVIPEINAGTASLIASTINPAIGIGTFLAQMFLRRPLIEAATQEFVIQGPWADPVINKVSRKSPPGAQVSESAPANTTTPK